MTQTTPSTATTRTARDTARPTGVDPGASRIVVPADIDAPDRIAWGLSFRQLAILAAGGGTLWAAYSRFRTLLPTVGWVAAAILVVAVTVVVALGRRDGLPLDVWVRHGLTLHTAARLSAPGEPASGRPLLRTAGRPAVPAPLRSRLTRFATDGTLTVDGTARRVIACGTTGVGLRTGAEQDGLLAGFGRWLNALTAPTQIVISTTRHDLTPHADQVLDGLPGLADPALRAAARDYAAFLLDLDATREPLRRQVLTVIPAEPTTETSTRALSGLGVTAEPLDGPATAAALAAAVDPYDPPVPGDRAVPGNPITLRRSAPTVPHHWPGPAGAANERPWTTDRRTR